MVRGLMSPTRSKFSPRNNVKAATNLQPKPTNNVSSGGAPVNPEDHQRSHRKETHPFRTTKNKERYSITSPLDPSKSTSSTMSSSRRQQIETPPSRPMKKKSETNNSTPQITTISSSSSTPNKPISQPTPGGSTPSNTNVKGPIGKSGSRSDNSGANASGAAKDSASKGSPNKYLWSGGLGHQQHVKIGNLTHSHSPEPHSQLHQLSSIEGKDIYESIGSETKEEECSSQINANNGRRIFEIYKEIASHRQGNSSVTSYFTKLKALWDELATYIETPQCSSGSRFEGGLSEHIVREKVVQFLVGLDDSYSTICAQILLMSPFPTLEEAFIVIIREETHRELLLSLESIAAKVNNWVPQNGHSNNNGTDNDIIEQIGDNLNEQQVDQNEATTFPIEPVLC